MSNYFTRSSGVKHLVRVDWADSEGFLLTSGLARRYLSPGASPLSPGFAVRRDRSGGRRSGEAEDRDPQILGLCSPTSGEVSGRGRTGQEKDYVYITSTLSAGSRSGLSFSKGHHDVSDGGVSVPWDHSSVTRSDAWDQARQCTNGPFLGVTMVLCYTCKAIPEASDLFDLLESLYSFFMNHDQFAAFQKELHIEQGELVQISNTQWAVLC
ncbi:hypothetical protein N1851_004140 [Merluccius polli]|uniref:Uncharacterized protein n=1 Tax=Merluccius polli TaxID=89951 RepID=A0AA47N8D5_MERPO|nr:hypothetical protein N1851_004140 [Merluccius polli]